MAKRTKTPPRTTPYPRSGHCISSFNHLLISYGGYTHRQNTVYHELWSFNVITKQWNQLDIEEFIEHTCLSSAMIRLGDCIYIFGGTHFPFSLEMSNSINMYRITDKTWEVLSETELNNDFKPSPRYGSAIFHYSNHIYIFGGCLGSLFCNDMFKFNLSTLLWEIVPQAGHRPDPSYRIYGTVVKNLYYISDLDISVLAGFILKNTLSSNMYTFSI